MEEPVPIHKAHTTVHVKADGKDKTAVLVRIEIILGTIMFKVLIYQILYCIDRNLAVFTEVSKVRHKLGHRRYTYIKTFYS